MFHIEKSRLPENAKEGDVLNIDDDVIIIDYDETEQHARNRSKNWSMTCSIDSTLPPRPSHLGRCGVLAPRTEIKIATILETERIESSVGPFGCRAVLSSA